ncbi:multiple monosaccharide ABC transporter permease [Carnobacterium jeotgali]|uniref:multiple monosaccharide ABC transporter permease n=1 Tax=Carnobacterium jeotgali TaxID=545534 RepID=UPI00388EB1E4
MKNENIVKTSKTGNFDVSKSLKNVFGKYSMYIFLAVIIVLFQILTDGTLLRPINITNVILQNSYVFILTIGMLMLVLLGDIDLSVGSVMAFTGAISALLIIKYDLNPIISIIICLLIGLAIGAWHGFWVAYVNVPAFIATLAGLLTFRGLTIVVLDGKTIASYPNIFQSIGSGFIPDLFNENLHIITLIIGAVITAGYVFMSWTDRNKNQKLGAEIEPKFKFLSKIIIFSLAIIWITYILASYEGIPNVLIIVVVFALVAKYITSRTTVGRHLYAIGGNEKAAALSGIDTKKVKFWTFAFMGFMAAVAGLIFSARLNAASASAGDGFELDAIAACYIGGASTSGGIGTVIGALVGAMVMALLNNGMSLMGVGVDWQQAIKGLVLLFAVAIDIYNKKKKES